MDNLLKDIEPDVKHMNNETLFRGGGGGKRVMKVHGGIAKQIQHCLLSTYPHETPKKKGFYCVNVSKNQNCCKNIVRRV